MTHNDNDYDGPVPDVGETFTFPGSVLVVATIVLVGPLAGAAVVAAWLVLR